MNLKVLDLCGGSRAWSDPYLKKGYIVINVTLPEYDVRTFVPPDDVYGILAAPPCTQFSVASGKSKTPEQLREGMKLVIACLKIIWDCQYKNRLAFWCLENPRGRLRWFLGKPVFTFDPCDFGDLYTKKTDLWGYFNIPKGKASTLLIPEYIRNVVKSSKERSRTPEGFANAFFRANK